MQKNPCATNLPKRIYKIIDSEGNVQIISSTKSLEEIKRDLNELSNKYIN